MPSFAGSAGKAAAGKRTRTPATSSPPFFASPELRQRAAQLRPLARHLKFLEGEHNGYTLLDVTRERVQAEWYHVETVAQRTDKESKAASFVCENGSSRLSQS